MVVPVTVCAVAPNPTVELLFTAAVEEGQGEGSGIRWHISQYAHPPPEEVVFPPSCEGEGEIVRPRILRSSARRREAGAAVQGWQQFKGEGEGRGGEEARVPHLPQK